MNNLDEIKEDYKEIMKKIKDKNIFYPKARDKLQQVLFYSFEYNEDKQIGESKKFYSLDEKLLRKTKDNKRLILLNNIYDAKISSNLFIKKLRELDEEFNNKFEEISYLIEEIKQLFNYLISDIKREEVMRAINKRNINYLKETINAENISKVLKSKLSIELNEYNDIKLEEKIKNIRKGIIKDLDNNILKILKNEKINKQNFMNMKTSLTKISDKKYFMDLLTLHKEEYINKLIIKLEDNNKKILKILFSYLYNIYIICNKEKDINLEECKLKKNKLRSILLEDIKNNNLILYKKIKEVDDNRFLNFILSKFQKVQYIYLLIKEDTIIKLIREFINIDNKIVILYREIKEIFKTTDEIWNFSIELFKLQLNLFYETIIKILELIDPKNKEMIGGIIEIYKIRKNESKILNNFIKK